MTFEDRFAPDLGRAVERHRGPHLPGGEDALDGDDGYATQTDLDTAEAATTTLAARVTTAEADIIALDVEVDALQSQYMPVVEKTADETVTNSDALQSDNELLYALGASDIIEFEARLIAKGPSAGDLKIEFTVPAGAVGSWHFLGEDTSPAVVSAIHAYGGAGQGIQVTATEADGGIVRGLIRGYVANGATPGNLQLQWAQNTANAAATTMMLGSRLFIRVIAT